MSPIEWLTVEAVALRLGVSRGRVYELIKAGKFPPSTHMLHRRSVWAADVVTQYADAVLTPKIRAVPSGLMTT